MNKTIINLTEVTKSFRVKNQEVKILHGIDLEIREGDFSIIFGPSGCGKSTLLHIILGLENPTSGKTSFLDQDLYASSEDVRAEFRKNNIGMIYQQPNWIKSLSVVENVAFSMSLLGIAKKEALGKALAILQTVGMVDWADYHPTELSSGQQQKVALARALVSDPQVIIADEPTGNLDYQSGIELIELLRKLNKEGKTIIMVTHNIENLDYAGKVIQMFNGRIIKIFEVTAQSIRDIKKALLDRIVFENKPASSPEKLSQKNKKDLKMPFLQRFSITEMKHTLRLFTKNLLHMFIFLGLLWAYMTKKITDKILRFIFIPNKLRIHIHTKLEYVYSRLIAKFEVRNEKTISRVDLIDLSIKNMLSKRTRTYITVGGMIIGIGTIVFLVSIGYGLEKLVISRVARLEEMKQIDATPAVSSNILITDEALAKFKDIAGIYKILPLIGVVGTINYQNSSTDVAVYGVLSDYLNESAIKPVEGKIFTSNTLTLNSSDAEESTGFVAGVSTSSTDLPAVFGEAVGAATYSILPNEQVRVRKKPTASSEILGYTRRVEGTSSATEYWGGSYTSDDGVGKATTDKSGKQLGRWLKATVLLWDEQTEDGKIIYVEKLDENGKQVQVEGYFAELSMQVTREVAGVPIADALVAKDDRVLGESTTASESSFIDVSEIDSTTSAITETKPNKITLPKEDTREVVVNKALLKVLGIEGLAVGKTFDIAFTATGELVASGSKIESVPVTYTIIGVTPDTKTPIAYVPIRDVKQLGISSYSQAKLVVNSQEELTKTRKQVELLGFKTVSVVDTVAQIENLFGTLRFILGVLGVVALSVAALGMLNTMTVSLLERTHEVGMMKAIGMKSVEVEDLYLTESMIMGIMGGIGGLLLGFLAGKVVSVLLSVFAVSKGYGFLDIVYIPYSFVALILVISLLVGLLTGIYPAKRATKISALDALRYE